MLRYILPNYINLNLGMDGKNPYKKTKYFKNRENSTKVNIEFVKIKQNYMILIDNINNKPRYTCRQSCDH